MSLQLVSLPPSPLEKFQFDFPSFVVVVFVVAEYAVPDPIAVDCTSLAEASCLSHHSSIEAVAAAAVDPTVLEIEEVA